MCFRKLRLFLFLIYSLGSFVEFVKIAPMLIQPDHSRDYVFEVIAPSIPGKNLLIRELLQRHT